MRLNTASLLGTALFGVGLILDGRHLWFPATVALAGFFWVFARPGASSNEIGANVALSSVLKLVCNLIGLYATLGQFAAIILAGWWLFVEEGQPPALALTANPR